MCPVHIIMSENLIYFDFSLRQLGESFRLFAKLTKLMNSVVGRTENHESTTTLDSLPPELLASILSFVPPHDLVYNCRFVCKNWNQLIIDDGSDVWKQKLQNSNSESLSQLNSIQRRRLKLPWYICYQICFKDPVGKNLLRNNCGRWVPEYYPNLYGSQYEHWELLSSDNVQCSVIRYPFGYHPFPASEDVDLNPIFRTCFFTGNELRKQQTIDLREHGLSKFIMDEMQPKIIASEWFSGTENVDHIPGADAEYALTVSLLSSDRQSIIQQKEVLSSVEDWEEHEWKKVTLEFENYGPDVRYIVFHHYAKEDHRIGGLGTRMGGGVVKVALPFPPESLIIDVPSNF